MPWKVTDVMQVRIRFVSEVLRGQENMSELCRWCDPNRMSGTFFRSVASVLPS